MRVVCFMKHKKCSGGLAALERSRKVALETYPQDAVKQWISENASEADDELLVYLDISDMAPAERTRTVRTLLDNSSRAVGLIDPKSDIIDVAPWFHEGAVDYVGSGVLSEGIKPKRVDSALTWWKTRTGTLRGEYDRPSAAQSTNDPTSHLSWDITATTATREEDPADRNGHRRFPIDPNFPTEPIEPAVFKKAPENWSRMVEGNEYTFILLYIGLDLDAGVSRDSRPELLQRSLKSFQQAVQMVVEPYGGRLWFWKDTSGLVLFPFDGAEGTRPIVAAMRLSLQRLFWQAEGHTNYITKRFRLGLHLGNTTYREGIQRETLVSNMVNFMFHLGDKHAAADDFVATSEIMSYCPTRLRPYFVGNGTFKGHRVWRMRRIVAPGNRVPEGR